MESIVSQIKKRLPEAISQIIRADSMTIEGSAREIASSFGIEFEIEGIVTGKIALFFTSPELISKRFLEVTIGDTTTVANNDVCHEVANQALGRLFGTLSNVGEEIRLGSYGIQLSSDNHTLWESNSRYLTAIETKGYGNIHVFINAEEPEDVIRKSDSVKDDISGNSESKPVKVLIVDDSPVMCAFLEKVFKEANFEIVAIATDGLAAIEMFKKFSPDLTTLDIMMPKMRGTDVLKEIMQIDPSAVVIMASSIADAKTVMSCLRMGAKRYIVKPYDKDAVMIAINKALNLSEK